MVTPVHTSVQLFTHYPHQACFDLLGYGKKDVRAALEACRKLLIHIFRFVRGLPASRTRLPAQTRQRITSKYSKRTCGNVLCKRWGRWGR